MLIYACCMFQLPGDLRYSRGVWESVLNEETEREREGSGFFGFFFLRSIPTMDLIHNAVCTERLRLPEEQLLMLLPGLHSRLHSITRSFITTFTRSFSLSQLLFGTGS